MKMYISTSLLCIQFHIDLANKRQQNKCYFYTIIRTSWHLICMISLIMRKSIMLKIVKGMLLKLKEFYCLLIKALLTMWSFSFTAHYIKSRVTQWVNLWSLWLGYWLKWVSDNRFYCHKPIDTHQNAEICQLKYM